MSVGVPPDVSAYVSDLAAALGDFRSDLVGVYLHGSAVLGGFRPTGSDVDVLAVVRESGPVAVQQAMGEVIVGVGGCPGAGLEMSVITGATATALGDCQFEVHVNTTGEEVRAGQPLAHIFSQELLSSQTEVLAARRNAAACDAHNHFRR